MVPIGPCVGEIDNIADGGAASAVVGMTAAAPQDQRAASTTTKTTPREIAHIDHGPFATPGARNDPQYRTRCSTAELAERRRGIRRDVSTPRVSAHASKGGTCVRRKGLGAIGRRATRGRNSGVAFRQFYGALATLYQTAGGKARRCRDGTSC